MGNQIQRPLKETACQTQKQNDKQKDASQQIENDYLLEYHPLDKMLKNSFYFKKRLNVDQYHNCYEFLQNNQAFYNRIIQYLIFMIEGVCSKTFDLLLNNQSSQDDIKSYACKNMLQNIKGLCLQISKIIKQNLFPNIDQHGLSQKKQSNKQNKIIKAKGINMLRVYVLYLIEQREQLIRQIIDMICTELSVTVKAISYKYPSTPLSGYSLKLKNMINKIDFRQDYSLEFFYLNQIIIKKPQSNPQELTQQIMLFLNKIIELPYQLVDQKDDQTYLQSFIKFNKNLVWIISQNFITEEKIKSNKKNICTELCQFLIKPQENLNNLRKNIKQSKSEEQFKKKYYQELFQYEISHKYLANQKIPKNTPRFDDNEIQNIDFKIKSSNLLRVLTKWVEDLQQTLEKSEKYIRDNGYKFKDDQNNLIELNQEQRGYLYTAVKEASTLYKQKNNSTNKTFIIDSLLESQIQQSKYSFEASLKISSKLNAYVAKQTFKQLVQLLNIIFSIPETAANQFFSKKMRKYSNPPMYEDLQETKRDFTELKKVNLVCNRLGDLLRSKIFCTELQFCKLLTFIYAFDQYCQNNPLRNGVCFFKIIRIKNKLKQSTNNVHLNYLFYGKIQCQLQICFLLAHQETRIQKINSMHHFFYELIRGKYGIVPQLACIVNQNDPININSNYLNTARQKYSPISIKVHPYQERSLSKSQKNKYLWRCIFKKCDEYSLQGRFKFIKGQKDKYYCLKCYLNTNKSEQNIYISLSKLQYGNEQWVKRLLIQWEQLKIKQISKLSPEDINSRGIYLMIYPTNKKVIVDLYLIFYREIPNQQLIIKSLYQESKTKAKEVSQELLQQHDKKTKFYIKIDYFAFQAWIKAKQESNLTLRQIISKDWIRQTLRKGLQQVDSEFLRKQIKNKQKKLRLNNRYGVIKEFQSYLQQQNLKFITTLYAQALKVRRIQSFNKMRKIKQLFLQGNQIEGKLLLQNYPYLVWLDLSNNQITAIQFKNTNNLRTLLLNYNRLIQLNISDSTPLQRLQMQYNQLQGSLILSKLNELSTLNINGNYISVLDIKSCASITKLNCSRNKLIDIFFPINIKINELSAWNTLISSESFKLQDFSELQIVRLKVSEQNYEFINKEFQCLKELQLVIKKYKGQDELFPQSLYLSEELMITEHFSRKEQLQKNEQRYIWEYFKEKKTLHQEQELIIKEYFKQLQLSQQNQLAKIQVQKMLCGYLDRRRQLQKNEQDLINVFFQKKKKIQSQQFRKKGQLMIKEYFQKRESLQQSEELKKKQKELIRQYFLWRQQERNKIIIEKNEQQIQSKVQQMLIKEYLQKKQLLKNSQRLKEQQQLLIKKYIKKNQQLKSAKKQKDQEQLLKEIFAKIQELFKNEYIQKEQYSLLIDIFQNTDQLKRSQHLQQKQQELMKKYFQKRSQLRKKYFQQIEEKLIADLLMQMQQLRTSQKPQKSQVQLMKEYFQKREELNKSKYLQKSEEQLIKFIFQKRQQLTFSQYLQKNEEQLINGYFQDSYDLQRQQQKLKDQYYNKIKYLSQKKEFGLEKQQIKQKESQAKQLQLDKAIERQKKCKKQYEQKMDEISRSRLKHKLQELKIRQFLQKRAQLQQELPQFLRKQNNLINIKLYVQFAIRELDLSNLHHIESFDINTQYLNKLKLNSVSKININAKLHQLSVKQPRNISQLIIYKANIRQNYQLNYQNIEVLSVFGIMLDGFVFEFLQSIKQIKLFIPEQENDQQKHHQFKCNNNNELNKLYLHLYTEVLQVKNCEKLQHLHLSFSIRIAFRKVQLDLPKLKSITCLNLTIKDFTIKATAQNIKNISLNNILLWKELKMTFYDQHRISLQKLQLSDNIRLQNFYSILDNISKIQLFKYQISSQLQIRPSSHQQNQIQYYPNYCFYLSNLTNHQLIQNIDNKLKSTIEIDEFYLFTDECKPAKMGKVVLDFPIKSMRYSINFELIILQLSDIEQLTIIEEDEQIVNKFQVQGQIYRMSQYSYNLKHILLSNQRPDLCSKVIFKVSQSRKLDYKQILVDDSQIGQLEVRLQSQEEAHLFQYY